MPLGIEIAVRGVHPRAVRGLLHGKRIQHGFQCVDKGKRPRTRRDWQPNVQYKFLYSEALQRKLKVCVTTHALKRIDKAGGLDMYLLTEPMASQGSVVAAELRKAVKQAYKEASAPLPQKQGNTSILGIVQERLCAAGLAQTSPLTKRKWQGTTPTQTCTTVTASESTASVSRAIEATASAAAWSPFVKPPHTDVPRTLRARRKALAIRYILNKKGSFPPGDRDRYAKAREAVRKDIQGLNRHQLLCKVPKDQRGRLGRALKAVTRPRQTSALTSGKRVDQPMLEAVRRQQIRMRQVVKRRNGLVSTMRGTARNQALKQLAVDPRWSGVFRHGWLQDLVAAMEEGPVKEQWTRLADKYQPNVPGVIIDGCFIPVASRHNLPRIPSIPPSIAASPQGTHPAKSTTVGRVRPAELQRVTNAAALHARPKRPLRSTLDSYLKGHSPEEAGLRRNAVLRKSLLRKHLDYNFAQAYPVGRKLQKMRKWLDDDWVRAHAVPQTGPWQFVLGNGMVLPSRTRQGQALLRRHRGRKQAWSKFKAAGGIRGAQAGALHTAELH